MAKVLYHVTMSLDGCIAGPEHSMSWMTQLPPDEPPVEGLAVAGTSGAALAGRNGYDVGRKAGSKLYGGAFSGAIFVLTHNPPTDETDPAYTFVSGDIRPIVGTALDAADGKDVLILGGTIAAQCVEAGLLDEIFVHISPVLLGQGIPLFPSSLPPVVLDPISNTQVGRTTNLRYRVVR
ncbi:dihydrofolate reductase family protein [Kribbella sp. CA-293567]|uniref:dihydrofolate reductase family protein n=1 Tax=Kribbella sp. CA-293567 TaxID=3002436 RepID=UPI0022DD8399|nr:dihydrofolate reductase family protein [Kribbella sp. CA-293567]WBQ02573.1 dihydrofolate reductase family protein [Kribbella sp. CA-293567]